MADGGLEAIKGSSGTPWTVRNGNKPKQYQHSCKLLCKGGQQYKISTKIEVIPLIICTCGDTILRHGGLHTDF